MSGNWLNDLRALIESSPLDKLREHAGDPIMKKHRTTEPIGVQGIILDAMDDGHITPPEASRLQVAVGERIYGPAVGGQVRPDGGIRPLFNAEATDGR